MKKAINWNLKKISMIEIEANPADFTLLFYKDIYTEENLRKMGLNERQIKAVMYVKEKGKITNHEYQNLTGCSKPMATIDLRELSEKNIFLKKGRTGKGSYYELVRANKGLKGLIKE